MMKKLFQLLFLLIFVSQSAWAGNQPDVSKDVLTKGKWVNYSDGYVPVPTYKEDEAEGEKPETVKRFKMLTFEENGSFILDSAKQRYTGRYYLDNNQISMEFNSVQISHLRKNTDPNQVSGYNVSNHMVKLPNRNLRISNDGHLTGDGSSYKNYSGAVAGLFNFYEFSGFANASWGNIIMMLVAFIFIFLAIKYDFEPMLLIPIGFGILIGNIPMFQVADFNLKLGVYEPGSVMNILYQGVVQGWYPPLIFLGIGAMTDFSSLISNPKLMLLGAAAQETGQRN